MNNSNFLQFLLLFFSMNIQSEDLKIGQKIFVSNCNVCHMNGNNIIIPEKNLKKEALETNGMYNLEAIIYQITNGKNGMPAFGGRLTETEIENVSNYILEETNTNFKKN